MIITIIAVAVLTIGILVGIFTYDDWGIPLVLIGGAACIIIFGLLALKPLINNEVIDQYTATEKIIEQGIEGNNVYIVNEIVEINTTILTHRRYIDNPFTNWFCSKKVAELDLLEAK